MPRKGLRARMDFAPTVEEIRGDYKKRTPYNITVEDVGQREDSLPLLACAAAAQDWISIYPRSTVARQQAQKFAGLIKGGMQPGEAAWRMHTTLKRLMENDEIKKQVQELVKNYHFSAEVRKLMVRAGFNKLALENINAADPKDKKIALDALKEIASDTEVGVKAPPQINVGIAIDPNLRELLDDTELPAEVLDILPAEDRKALPAPNALPESDS